MQNTASILHQFGFSKRGVNKNLLKQNFNSVKRGNFNIFQIFNGNVGRGPLLPNSGLFVITKPPNKKWCVLFARKAMGGDRNRNKPGERYKVGHTYYKTRQRVQAYGKHSGAAGTNPRYWGKWVSIGGKNDKRSKSNFEASISEFKDEASIGSNITKHLHYLYSFSNRSTMIYVAYLPWTYASKLNSSRGTKKNLIFSSKGEIAELRWVPFDRILNNTILKNGIADYIKKSYAKYVHSFMKLLNRI